MLNTLGLHAIGLPGRAIPDAIDLARRFGFDAITFDIREAAAIADDHGLDHLRALFAEARVRPGSWNLPVAYRDDDKLQADLDRLPALAALGAALGCTRATTGVAPGSNERPYDEQFAWTVDRLRPAAEALRAAGCRLGIEFIGPKTFRAPFRHEFIYSLGGIRELAAAIGTGNVGVLLDHWHLYTSGGDLSEIDGLTAAEVVAVHVNDAPAGVTRDEQIDSVRALPLETGVLDGGTFLRKLASIGYDGPVMPEPFSARVDALAATDPDAAVRETAASMDALWRAAGLA